MTQANFRQIGGDHYKTGYEHWDLVLATGMGYLEGCATKYISRWRKKGGLDDLAKAHHYVEKLVEHAHTLGGPRHWNLDKSRLYQMRFTAESEVRLFSEINKLSDLEAAAILAIVSWKEPGDLVKVQDMLIEIGAAKPVPLTEENHHAERASSSEGEAG